MKIKTFLIIVITLSLIFESKAQHFFLADDSGRSNLMPNTDITVKPLISKGYKGTPYLSDDWNLGKIIFQDGHEIESIPIKYHIMNEELEVQHENQIKTSPYHLISSFEWGDIEKQSYRQFINAKNFSIELEGVPLTKFLEVLVDEEHKLYCKYDYEIQSPDYVPTHNVGSVDPEIKQQEYYYLGIDNQLYLIKGKKKNIANLFIGQEDAINKYIKDNQLKLKKREDLIQLVSYYNSLEN